MEPEIRVARGRLPRTGRRSRAVYRRYLGSKESKNLRMLSWRVVSVRRKRASRACWLGGDKVHLKTRGGEGM